LVEKGTIEPAATAALAAVASFVLAMVLAPVLDRTGGDVDGNPDEVSARP
jgi:hypothetical protein